MWRCPGPNISSVVANIGSIQDNLEALQKIKSHKKVLDDFKGQACAHAESNAKAKDKGKAKAKTKAKAKVKAKAESKAEALAKAMTNH